MPTNRPGRKAALLRPRLSDLDLQKLLDEISDRLEIIDGVKGDPLDRAITFRDLQTSGFDVDLGTLGSLGIPTISGIPDGSSGTGGPTTAPSNLVATGIWFSIQLVWDNPTTNLQHIEVWRNSVDNLSGAIMIGTTTGTFYVDYIGSNATRYYWVRAIGTDGTPSAYNSTSGTSATTSSNPVDVLFNLQEEISESQLTTALQTRIDGIETNSAAIAVEETIRAEETGELQALYTVRAQIDTNGNPYMVGFGLSADLISSGTHTGANNASTLTDSSKNWDVNELVGEVIYNITDGSSGSITANTATTITATLSGGSQNDWDTGDEYSVNMSNFFVMAERFAVLHPSYPSDPNNSNYRKAPFIVDASKGIIGIDGQLVVTGTITATEIAAGAVTADKIAANAVTAAKIQAGVITADKLAATLTMTNTMILSTNGRIYTSGKSDFSDTNAGIYFGYDASEADYVINVGDANEFMSWDGSTFTVQGDLRLGSAGTFSPTWGGFSSDPTGTMYYHEMGTIALMWWVGSNGTSNSSSFTFSGIPAAIRPASTIDVLCNAARGASTTLSIARIAADGSVTMFNSDTSTAIGTSEAVVYANDWNTTGLKGLLSPPLIWPI